MIQKISKFLIASTLIIFSFDHPLNAQNAANISDQQLLQVIREANQRGMSQEEVAKYAKSKGYSDADINSLIQKASSLNAGVVNNGIQSDYNYFAERQVVQIGNDLMATGSDSTLKLNTEQRKIFGYAVFHNKGMSFTPNLNMATPKDYVVGPGDELMAQIYGIAQSTINIKVSPEGKVVIPNVGVAHLAGLSIEAVKSLLTQKLGTRYAGLTGANPSSFLMVTLSNIRSIKINIVGEVETPGTYNLPSFTSSFNALYAAGGPTTKGSFRNIQVFRAGKQIVELDVYDFLLNGKTDKNIRLEDNDVLLVPQYGKRVEIVGEVRRNLMFEVKDKETIDNLVEFANGFTSDAYKKMITIQRYNGVDKSILNINEKEQLTTTMLDGDYVIVGKNPNTYKNRIQIIGAVLREGDYELQTNLRISDLINKAGGLKPEAFSSRAILYRTNKNFQKIEFSIDLNKALEKDTAHNLILNKEDLLVISSIYDIKENYFVSIQGEVNQIGTFPYVKGMNVSDLILNSHGFKEAASGSFIEIVRRVRDNNNEIAKIIKVDINKDLSIGPNDKNVTLEPFDQIYVRASIGFRNLKKVYVQGEANYTGQFIMDRTNMTVGDLLKRAGGVLSSANVNGALLIRRTIFYKNDANEDAQLNTLLELKSRYQDSTRSGFSAIDKIQLKQINQQIKELSLKKLKSEAKNTGIGNIANQPLSNQFLVPKNKLEAENKKEIIKTEQENIEELKTSLQARVFKNLSDVLINEDQYQFVSINLDKIINNNITNKFDLQLQEGDILYIPTYNETVVVNGDVLYPVVIKYNDGNTLNDYINQAGGFNITALRKRSYVVEANGSVKRTKNFLWFKFYPSVGPGSIVFVPKNNKPASTFNIDRTLGLVSSLVTTYLLVKNLSK